MEKTLNKVEAMLKASGVASFLTDSVKDKVCHSVAIDIMNYYSDLIHDLIQQAKELEEIFELRHKADMRAITMWREKHPERELTLPDHADMVVWLLERLDKFEDTLKQEIVQNLSTALEIEQAKAEVAREIEKELLTDRGGKDIGQAETDLKANQLPTLYSYRQKHTLLVAKPSFRRLLRRWRENETTR